MAKFNHVGYGSSTSTRTLNFWLCVHPEDQDQYLPFVSKSINNALSKEALTQSWSLWYDEEPLADHDESSLSYRLSRMKAFIVVITKKFLSTDNRALSVEFKYAVANNTPILPLMMEEGLDVLFAEKCGNIQYLLPSDSSYTSVLYSTKLANFLSSFFIAPKLYSEILNEFDSTVFLSYRKMDRKQAQEVMEIIHRNDEFRDVAIWYDEFLTPGEDYNELITDEIKNSRAFVMAITHNTTAMSVNSKGQPSDNYIVTDEYPAAIEAGIPIIPVLCDFDSQITKFNVEWKFPGIPEWIPVEQVGSIHSALKKALQGVEFGINRGKPRHEYLIGLAYLTGTRVEINKPKAIELITSAAKAGYDDAMAKIANIYQTGNGVVQDVDRSLYWHTRILEGHKKELNNPVTRLDSLSMKYLIQLLMSQCTIMALLCAIHQKCDRIEAVLEEMHELQETYKETVYKSEIDEQLQNIYNIQAEYPPVTDENKEKYCIRAYEHAEKLMSEKESQNRVFGFSKCAFSFAQFYNQNRNTAKALDFSLRAEAAAERAMHIPVSSEPPVLISSKILTYSEMCEHYCVCAYFSAELLLKQKRLEEAERCFYKAQTLSEKLPSDSKATKRNNLKFSAYLMNFALSNKNFEKAKEYYLKISSQLENNTTISFEIYELLGIYRETVGDYSGAEKLYIKALNNLNGFTEYMKPEDYVNSIELLTLLSVLFKKSGSHTLSESYAVRANEYRESFAAAYPTASLGDMIKAEMENLFYLPDGVADVLTREEEKKRSSFSSDASICKSAENYMKLAERHLSVGNLSPAKHNFLKAIELLEDLCRNCPDEHSYAEMLELARKRLTEAEAPPPPTDNGSGPARGGVLSRLFRHKKNK